MYHLPTSSFIIIYNHVSTFVIIYLCLWHPFLIICSKAPACPTDSEFAIRGMEKLYEESEGKPDAKPAHENLRTNPDVKEALVTWLQQGQCLDSVALQKGNHF